MHRLSVFHSRLGAAALAAALHYSYGAAGQAELLPSLRRLPNICKQPRAFVRTGEAILVVADGKREMVLQRAITNAVERFRPDLEIVFYAFDEKTGPLAQLGLWLLGRSLLPETVATSLSQCIWDGVR